MNRRPRYRRHPTGKRIELSPRDIEVFKLLARYRYLRSTQIFRFVGGKSENRFKKRLGDLYHDGRYIDRPVKQWEAYNARYAPAIYELGPVDIQVGGGDSPGWDFLIQGSEMEVDLGSTCLERHTV